GLITDAQLDSARNVLAKTPGKYEADVYRELGAKDAEVQQVLARICAMPFEHIDPANVHAQKYLDRLGLDYCEQNGVMPLRRSGGRAAGRLTLGVTRPD